MKPYMFAARLRFDSLALAFTVRMFALTVLALMPGTHRRRGRDFVGLDFARAKQYRLAMRNGRAYVFTWRSRTLKALAGRHSTWRVQSMVNEEALCECKRGRRNKAQPNREAGGNRPAFYDSRGERKPSELQRLRVRVRQLVHLEMERHGRRQDAVEGLGV